MDCSKTENYFQEKIRMTNAKTKGCCTILCDDCPLCRTNNNIGCNCTRLELSYPQIAIEIVQKWSDEHPPKTYLSEFLKHYPNAKLDDDGTPFDICLADLGLCECCVKADNIGNIMSEKDCTCKDCWNTPITEDN